MSKPLNHIQYFIYLLVRLEAKRVLLSTIARGLSVAPHFRVSDFVLERCRWINLAGLRLTERAPPWSCRCSVVV